MEVLAFILALASWAAWGALIVGLIRPQTFSNKLLGGSNRASIARRFVSVAILLGIAAAAAFSTIGTEETAQTAPDEMPGSVAISFLLGLGFAASLVVGVVAPQAFTWLFRRRLRRRYMALMFGGATIAAFAIGFSLVPPELNAKWEEERLIREAEDRRQDSIRQIEEAREEARERREKEAERAREEAESARKEREERLKNAEKDLPDESEAFVMSQWWVKERLIAPSTADFPWSADRVLRSLPGSTYVVTSYVDAQNAFGATIRTRYIATLKWVGGDWSMMSSWRLIDLETW